MFKIGFVDTIMGLWAACQFVDKIMGRMPVFYLPAVYLLRDIKIYRINKLVIISHQTQQTQQTCKCKT
jgi:hypothetical protein